MTTEQKEVLKKVVVEYITGSDFKEILETYNEIDEMYENGDVSYDDFYELIDELKEKMLK